MMSGTGMDKLHMVTFILLAIGGLNWGLWALTGYDIGSYLPGGMSGTVAKTVYILVGLSAVYEIVVHKKNCKACERMKGMGGSGMQSGMGMGK